MESRKKIYNHHETTSGCGPAGIDQDKSAPQLRTDLAPGFIFD